MFSLAAPHPSVPLVAAGPAFCSTCVGTAGGSVEAGGVSRDESPDVLSSVAFIWLSPRSGTAMVGASMSTDVDGAGIFGMGSDVGAFSPASEGATLVGGSSMLTGTSYSLAGLCSAIWIWILTLRHWRQREQ